MDLNHDVFLYTFSVDFLKQSPEGSVCLFTIKNPSFPDYISIFSFKKIREIFSNISFNFLSFNNLVMTESGVICCDIHQKYPYLLVIGKLQYSFVFVKSCKNFDLLQCRYV